MHVHTQQQMCTHSQTEMCRKLLRCRVIFKCISTEIYSIRCSIRKGNNKTSMKDVHPGLVWLDEMKNLYFSFLKLGDLFCLIIVLCKKSVYPLFLYVLMYISNLLKKVKLINFLKRIY